MAFIFKQFDEDWSIDLHRNFVSKGEILNENVIDQSINNILFTSYGERLFNRSFGVGLLNNIFENIDENLGEKILDEIIDSIKKWENRITVDENNCKLEIFPDSNSINIIIPYQIIRTGNYRVYETNMSLSGTKK